MTDEQKNIRESGCVEKKQLSIPMITQRERKIKCQNCERELDPEELRDKTEVVDFEGAFRRYSVCGYCGSDRIAEAVRCCGCSHLIVDYEDETEGYCTACTYEIAERFRRLIDKNFDDGEQEVLYTLFGVDMSRE